MQRYDKSPKLLLYKFRGNLSKLPINKIVIHILRF